MARAGAMTSEWESPVGAVVFLGSVLVSRQLSYATFGLMLVFGLVLAGGWYLRDGRWRIFGGWLVLSGVSQLVVWLIIILLGAPL